MRSRSQSFLTNNHIFTVSGVGQGFSRGILAVVELILRKFKVDPTFPLPMQCQSFILEDPRESRDALCAHKWLEHWSLILPCSPNMEPLKLHHTLACNLLNQRPNNADALAWKAPFLVDAVDACFLSISSICLNRFSIEGVTFSALVGLEAAMLL